MRYTQENVLQAGRDRKAGLNMSEKQMLVANTRNTVQIALQLGLEEQYGVAAYTAICFAIMEGRWDTESVKAQLISTFGEKGVCIREVLQILVKADILSWHKIGGKTKKGKNKTAANFKPKFWDKVQHLYLENIEKAEAAMLPLIETQDWVKGQESNMNLTLIRGVPSSVIKRVPQCVLNTVNKLQNVEFLVSTHLLAHRMNRWEEIETKARAGGRALYKGEKVVLQRQLMYLTELGKLQHPIKFMITLDYRGRFYYRGGVIQPQGHDFCKAAFQFAHKVKLGKHGKREMAIHYANVYGRDKDSIDDRIAWAEDVGSKLAKIITNGYYPKQADKPYQTIVAAGEWYRLMQHEAAGKKANTFMSDLVIHTDGTCNGIQHGAALTKDRATAERVNCTHADTSDEPQDIYKDGADEMAKYLRTAHLDNLAIIVDKYGRKLTKKPLMVTGYGAGSFTSYNNALAELDKEELASVEQQDEVFRGALDFAIQTVASSMVRINDLLSAAVAEKMMHGAVPLNWKTSDGFYVHQAKTVDEHDGAGDFTSKSRDLDPKGQETAIAANFIHSIDADHMRACVRTARFDMVTVHDSFGCHAGNMHKLNKIIRWEFGQIHRYDYVATLAKESDMYVELPVIGDYNPDEVLASPYFFS